MTVLKRILKPLVPKALLAWRAARITQRVDRDYAGRTPQEVFSRIYREGVWGDGGADGFFSGGGSHDPKVVDAYVSAVTKFVKGLEKAPRVVDIGCGDFNVGQRIRPACAGYVACDVVPELIERNKARYASLDVDFRCLDATADALPPGDVIFIRQVLQHMSNEQIAQVLSKLSIYRYLVLTENHPFDADFPPNLDKPTGSGTRLERPVPSGVVVTRPPFNFGAKSETLLCEVRDAYGVIRTIAYELP